MNAEGAAALPEQFKCQGSYVPDGSMRSGELTQINSKMD